jgi:hypothetical protein
MIVCEKCGVDFKKPSALIQHLRRKIPCNQLKKCLNPECSNNIKHSNKFCCPTCAGKVNSPGRKQSIETRRKISISLGGSGIDLPSMKSCLNCGKPVSRMFCNNTCKSEFTLNNLIKDWLEGKISGGCGSFGHASYVKKYLLKKYNNKCSKCGWGEINPFSKTIPLELEHIDGNPENNDPSNVDLLCPNCHSLTKTYKGANKGKGKRYDYYNKYYNEHYSKSKSNKL